MKPWVDAIGDHVKKWSARTRNDWWPKYAYHYTDVANAVSIILRGTITSRNRAVQLGLMKTDNACSAIISRTAEEHRDFVRLYFRPRTPTQYRNEGIRPEADHWNDAHCPMPVFFCFDLVQVLGRDDAECSDGNMASPSTSHCGSRDFFEHVHFEHVYHDGAIWSSEPKDLITRRRQAEVLVPDELPLLPAIRVIACRSPAERQTLLCLLGGAARKKWEPLIRIGYDDLFFRRWTYVEAVAAVEQTVAFQFNPNTTAPGPFQVEFAYAEDGKKTTQTYSGKKDDLNARWRVRLRSARMGVATLRLDGALAYQDRLLFTDAPF